MKRFATISLAVLALVILSFGGYFGCTYLGGELEPGKIGQACSTGGDCGYGEQCVGGLCAPNFCSTDAECPMSLQCCGNVCIPENQDCDAPCVTDADCDNGICLASRCIGACASDDDCPDGEFCVPYVNICLPRVQPNEGDGDVEDIEGEFPDIDIDLPFDIEMDLTQCATDEDCDRGRCQAGVCLDMGGPDGTGCESQGDCATGQYCAAGVCVGGTCETNEDCSGGLCIPAINQCLGGNPGNDRCMEDDDCNPGEQCIFGICIGTGPVEDGDTSGDEPGVECRADRDCENGEQCIMGLCLSLD